MPTAHINQWKHNRDFIGRVEPQFPDWAVTAAFYTALHAIDALLRHDKVMGVVSHESRNRTLMLTNRYARIWDLYQPLYDLARTVRYLASPTLWVPWSQIEGNVLRRYLYPLEGSVEKLIGRDLGLVPISLKS